MPPQLLISVRSAAEAVAALRGGADIIDVKEPAAGALGRAPWETIQAVVREVRSAAPTVAISAALGESIDWIDKPLAAFMSATESLPPVLPDHTTSLTYVKLGLAGMASTCGDLKCDNSTPDAAWQSRLKSVRASSDALLQQLGLGSREAHRAAPQWVAVAYTDHEHAGSPPIDDVLAEAIRSGAPVLLLDTFRKDQSTLLDWVTLKILAALRKSCLQEGILLALAGQLSLKQVPAVLSVQPDIIAVRGAACANGERGATVCADRVRSLKQAMVADAVKQA